MSGNARLLVAALLAATLSVALADEGARRPARERREARPEPETIRGTVVKAGALNGRIKVDTGSEVVTVQLAPQRYLREKGFVIAVDDRVEIRGRRRPSRAAVVVAMQVTRNGQVLALRDEHGKELWRADLREQRRKRLDPERRTREGAMETLSGRVNARTPEGDLIVQAAQTVFVDLPGGFLEQNDFQVKENDTVEVRGTRSRGGSLLLAYEIRKGEHSLRVREEPTPAAGSPTSMPTPAASPAPTLSSHP